jgi:hypothetical protein
MSGRRPTRLLKVARISRNRFRDAIAHPGRYLAPLKAALLYARSPEASPAPGKSGGGEVSRRESSLHISLHTKPRILKIERRYIV